jgi:hypothetical protein
MLFNIGLLVDCWFVCFHFIVIFLLLPIVLSCIRCSGLTLFNLVTCPFFDGLLLVDCCFLLLHFVAVFLCSLFIWLFLNLLFCFCYLNSWVSGITGHRATIDWQCCTNLLPTLPMPTTNKADHRPQSYSWLTELHQFAANIANADHEQDSSLRRRSFSPVVGSWILQFFEIMLALLFFGFIILMFVKCNK